MNVNSYIYQSPSSQSVQVGRLDPNSKSDISESSTSLGTNTNETAQKAQAFQSAQVTEVKPKVDTGNTLDIYA